MVPFFFAIRIRYLKFAVLIYINILCKPISRFTVYFTAPFADPFADHFTAPFAARVSYTFTLPYAAPYIQSNSRSKRFSNSSKYGGIGA